MAKKLADFVERHTRLNQRGAGRVTKIVNAERPLDCSETLCYGPRPIQRRHRQRSSLLRYEDVWILGIALLFQLGERQVQIIGHRNEDIFASLRLVEEDGPRCHVEAIPLHQTRVVSPESCVNETNYESLRSSKAAEAAFCCFGVASTAAAKATERAMPFAHRTDMAIGFDKCPEALLVIECIDERAPFAGSEIANYRLRVADFLKDMPAVERQLREKISFYRFAQQRPQLGQAAAHGAGFETVSEPIIRVLHDQIGGDLVEPQRTEGVNQVVYDVFRRSLGAGLSHS